MSECEKRGCPYYWQDETLPYPYCHYDDPVFPSPCEEEDYDYDDYVDEGNYDPYAGCDMYECYDAGDF